MRRNPAGTTRWQPALAVLVSSFILLPPAFASDATIELPREEKPIPIEKAPPAEKSKPQPVPRELGEEPGVDVSSVPRRVIHQLKDYNWEQSVNLHIGSFTILGYRDATNATDRMLFRFLTPEEHAERRVMNSKASLIGRKPMDTRPPLEVSEE